MYFKSSVFSVGENVTADVPETGSVGVKAQDKEKTEGGGRGGAEPLTHSSDCLGHLQHFNHW